MSLETLGGYNIIELLARGGMAEVYLAVTSGGGSVCKQVAIKRILRQYNQTADFVKMFHDEAKVAVQLRHKNIVTVFDFGVDRGSAYIVMEYVPGKSLSLLKEKLAEKGVQIPMEHALYLIKEIASGLAYAHNLKDLETGQPLNLIHRDITPQNIMFGNHGDVKIIDFGVAKTDMNASATQVGVIKGKYGYLSPEQLQLLPLDPRSDIFSLGILFWELLFNQKLFNFNVEVEYFAQLRDFKATIDLLQGRNFPAPVLQIILKMLQPNRDLRYGSAEEVLRDISMALNSLYPRYTEMDFVKFTQEWIPTYQISPQQVQKQLRTNSTDRTSNIRVTKNFTFRLPKGFAS